MNPMVRAAVFLMVSALTLYSIGVWSERWTARLEPWHVVLFWLGFVCDTVGTDMMRRLAGGLQFNLHSLTGALALALMLGHAIWATRVLRRHDDRREGHLSPDQRRRLVRVAGAVRHRHGHRPPHAACDGTGCR